MYEGNYRQSFWDVPLFGEHQEVRANRVDPRIINHESKRVITPEAEVLMSYKPREKGGGENHAEIRTAPLGIEEVLRI